MTGDMTSGTVEHDQGDDILSSRSQTTFGIVCGEIIHLKKE
jgi:hypothetical protein